MSSAQSIYGGVLTEKPPVREWLGVGGSADIQHAMAQYIDACLAQLLRHYETPEFLIDSVLPTLIKVSREHVPALKFPPPQNSSAGNEMIGTLCLMAWCTYRTTKLSYIQILTRAYSGQDDAMASYLKDMESWKFPQGTRGAPTKGAKPAITTRSEPTWSRRTKELESLVKDGKEAEIKDFVDARVVEQPAAFELLETWFDDLLSRAPDRIEYIEWEMNRDFSGDPPPPTYAWTVSDPELQIVFPPQPDRTCMMTDPDDPTLLLPVLPTRPDSARVVTDLHDHTKMVDWNVAQIQIPNTDC